MYLVSLQCSLGSLYSLFIDDQILESPWPKQHDSTKLERRGQLDARGKVKEKLILDTLGWWGFPSWKRAHSALDGPRGAREGKSRPTPSLLRTPLVGTSVTIEAKTQDSLESKQEIHIPSKEEWPWLLHSLYYQVILRTCMQSGACAGAAVI